MIIGDWSDKGNIHSISTPCVGIKRKLRQAFEVYHIDEFRTSKLHHITENEGKQLKIKFVKKKTKKTHDLRERLNRIQNRNQYKKQYQNDYTSLHSVLTFQMSNNRTICINRDLNAVRNMKKIVHSLIETKKRPIKYCRTQTSN